MHMLRSQFGDFAWNIKHSRWSWSPVLTPPSVMIGGNHILIRKADIDADRIAKCQPRLEEAGEARKSSVFELAELAEMACFGRNGRDFMAAIYLTSEHEYKKKIGDREKMPRVSPGGK
ncbi:hypothetical protein BofuT4_P142450.1 [Botrytis cinerea T4]|uniref:Uncharacterized protein n=1 Tax=Botryotinia fuckeliana (strain T4) TaxID=999810 RepID=G2YZD5_BOTF4|nr:hypothetical protein BofuT4_P142450.1 [Botrytis cinerea T4]